MDQVEVVTPPRTDDPFICTAYAEKVEPLAKMVEELLIEAASEIAIRLRPAGAVQ